MITIISILEVENYIKDMDGVIFDLDDTLYSEKEYVRSGFHKIAEYYPRVTMLEEKLWNSFETGGKPLDEVFESEGILSQKKKALEIYRYQQPNISLYPGVEAMLRRIKESGKKIGIITDGRPEGQHAKIIALGVQVDCIIVTDELGGPEYRKPHPKAFIEMQKKLNIPFEKLVYVGDNPKKDFIAPELLHMNAIFFANSDGLYSYN